MMGESLVDDILGAVRGPLQIARRVYNNFTTMSFTAAIGTSFGKDNHDHYDPPSLRRRSSARSRRLGQRSTEFRHSAESAIELDHTDGMIMGMSSKLNNYPTTTFADLGPVRKSSIKKRIPTSPVTTQADVTTLEQHSNPTIPTGQAQLSRRKSGSRGSSSGHGHFRVSSSGSTRKRSLRTPNPINHAALMALVNEMDKDAREKEQQQRDFAKEPEKRPQNINNIRADSSDYNTSDKVNSKDIKPSLSPVLVDLLATPL